MLFWFDCFKFLRIILTMTSAIITLMIAFLVATHKCGVDSVHMQCESDSQCPERFFCYLESQFCTHCVDCSSYMRKSSWRSCPKVPSDCGACLPGFQEEILHDGKTRDMCVQSIIATSLSHTVVPAQSAERYLWAAAIFVLLVPIVFYTFFKKPWKRERSVIHHSLTHEDPPPYRSIELTTISNDSVERLSEEDHKLEVGQLKDSLVQAVPFRQADYYVEPQFMSFDNNTPSEANSEVDLANNLENTITAEIDFHDDNTMPSNWSPNESENENGHGQLMTFEYPETQSPTECEEPVTKKRKSESSQEEESCNSHFNINLFINNNISITKLS